MMSLLMKHLYLQLFVATAFGFTLPSYIERCKRDDQLSQCIRSNIEATVPYLAQGIPKFYLPPLNPLSIKTLTMENQQISFRTDNLLVFGLDNFSLKDIDLNLDDCTFKLNVFFPALAARGLYSIKGSVIMLKLEGTGEAHSNVSNVDILLSMKGSKTTKNGKEYILFKDSEMDMKVGGPNNIYMDRLLGPNEEISKRLLDLINENSVEFLEEMLPALKDATVVAIERAIRTLFEKRSLNELFI